MQKPKPDFIKKKEKQFLSVNLETGEYGPQKKVIFDGFRVAKDRQIAGEKIAALSIQ